MGEIKKLFAYDLDDTLIKSKNRIKLTHKKTKAQLSFYTNEFDIVDYKDDYIFDYSDFGNLDLLKRSVIIEPVYNHLLEMQKTEDIAIVTARGERDTVKEYLKFININIPDELIYTVGDAFKGTMGNAPERKKDAFRELINRGYNEIYFYDDSAKNLNRVKTLETEYDVTINTVQIK